MSFRAWKGTKVNSLRCSRPWIVAENLVRRIAAHHERTMRIFERWVRERYR